MPRKRTRAFSPDDMERAEFYGLTSADRREAARRAPSPLATRGVQREVPPPPDCAACPVVRACHASTHRPDRPPGPFALPECEAALSAPHNQPRRWLLTLLARQPGATSSELQAALDLVLSGARAASGVVNIRATLSNMQRAGLVVVRGERPAHYTLTAEGQAAQARATAAGEFDSVAETCYTDVEESTDT